MAATWGMDLKESRVDETDQAGAITTVQAEEDNNLNKIGDSKNGRRQTDSR